MEEFKPQEGIKFPDIAQEINIMTEVDQNMREKEIDEPGSWDDSVDRTNTERMKEIISQIGWPTISKVGSESSSNAWLLVQHADHDTEFQRHCLSLMRQESKGEVSLHDIAYLEDRIRTRTKNPQLYGTQFNIVDGRFVPMEIEDPEHVEERRKEMGLTTMAENIDIMYRKYKMEKPKDGKENK